MEKEMFCQSCGMPIIEKEQQGTELNGSLSNDYCTYCYQNGSFTNTMTMDEMIQFCAGHVVEWDMNMTREEAITSMCQHFPKLKRLQKK